MKQTIIAAVAMVLYGVPLWGQQTSAPDASAQNAAMEQHIRDLEDRMTALEGKIRMLESAQSAAAQPAQPTAAAEAAAQRPQFRRLFPRRRPQ